VYRAHAARCRGWTRSRRSLDRREAEILVPIALGRSGAEIAGELYLSANTVETHINRVLSKTGSGAG
jgi:DNA-binding NarL/FixJ family response regulator